MKKIVILIGNYGSGKTEIALNMAVRAAAEGKRTQVIDLDKINDYFRMSDHVKLLDACNINLVSPTFAGAGLTQTNMPAAVASAFAQDWDLVVFDVGGDAVGSTALGRYHQDFMELGPDELEVLNVVNIRRPLAGTVEKIIRLQEEMQIHSRLKISGMINNTNLAQCTTPAELRDGYEMIREVSEKTGVPVLYTSGKKAMLDAFLSEGHDPKYIGTPLVIDTYMQRDWDSWIRGLNDNPFGVGEK